VEGTNKSQESQEIAEELDGEEQPGLHRWDPQPVHPQRGHAYEDNEESAKGKMEIPQLDIA
jgi:hypothetical protein